MRAIYCGIPLLHDEHREDWALWCEAVGLAPHFARRGPVFTDSNGVTEAAFAGMGMALLRRSFIAPALTQGRLVNPLAQPIALSAGLSSGLPRDRAAGACQPLFSRLAAWPAPGRC